MLLKRRKENMRKNVAALALLLTLIVSGLAIVPSALSVPPSPPSGGVAIWIEPETISYLTNNTPPDYKFKVYIKCNIDEGVAATYAWQIFLTYNKAHLKAVAAGLWDGTTEYPAGAGRSQWSDALPNTVPSPSYGSYDETYDYVLAGESLSGPVQQTEKGVFALAWIQFEIIGFPAKYETLTSELRLDFIKGALKTKFLTPAPARELPLSLGFATYRLTWARPVLPSVAVEPVETRFAKEPPPAINRTFNVDVVIKRLDPAWGLHNATFDLLYNDTLIGVVGYTVDPLWGACIFDNSTAGLVHVEVKNPTTTPGGALVKIVTITFKVLYQGAYPAVDLSPLDLENVHLFDTLAEIGVEKVTDGKVVIEGLLTLPMPYLEVSSVTLGPEYVVGQEFIVTVSIKNLHWAWYFIGVHFRLSYNSTLIEPVAVNEGPFCPYWASLQPGSLGTFWYGGNQSGIWGPHVIVGNLIYPNSTGRWNPPWPCAPGPNVTEGITAPVARITFKLKYQPPFETIIAQLNIIDQKMVGLDGPITQRILTIALAPPVNGTCTIYPWTQLGRRIDLYGGAVNDGYGAKPFPTPYGGQGPNKPMDLVTPQSWVQLYALVTYNGWPVQSKLVSFEVRNPNGEVFAKLTAITNGSGIATVGFRMPWPCENPESLFGVWKVIATVSIADVVVIDTMEFHYDYMVRLWKVTTDKYEYTHDDQVKITITYGTHAMQSYPVLIIAVIKDDLGVPIGMATFNGTVGGAEFCTYKNSTISLTITIPKWAYAGVATIHVNAFDKEPADGGFAWCPEYAPTPKIIIQPR